MRHLAIYTFFSFFYFTSQAQMQNLIWTKYDTSRSVDMKGFSRLTKIELELVKEISNFKNNRARLTLTDSGHKISPRELNTPNFPVICDCFMQNDTIFVTQAIGLMSGLGITISITRNYFGASYFEDADNTNIFKAANTDTSYVDNISVSTDKQKLTLLTSPLFKNNEIITGVFEGEFKKFYQLEFNTEPPLTKHYKAKIFFKCKLNATTTR